MGDRPFLWHHWCQLCPLVSLSAELVFRRYVVFIAPVYFHCTMFGPVNKFVHTIECDGRRQWHPTPLFLPGKSMGRGTWWAAVHGVAKSRTWLSDFTFTFHFHALEKEMAAHSSVLAWRIPGTAEPGGLPSKGSHRVGLLKWLNSSSSSSRMWWLITPQHC